MNNLAAIEIKNLKFGYESNTVLLDNITLSIPENSIVSILGKNGVGKTTFLNCIMGLTKGYNGTISFFGRKQSDFSRRELAKLIGFVPQLTQVSFDYTVEEFVLMGCNPMIGYFSAPNQEMYAIVSKTMDELEVMHLKNRKVNSLSGGERQLVYIARAIAQRSRIIILDEPTSALDFGNSLKIVELVKKMRDEGYTIIFTCHNPDYPFLFDDYSIAFFSTGKVLFGNTNDILRDDVLTELYNVPIKRVKLPNTDQYVCVRRDNM